MRPAHGDFGIGRGRLLVPGEPDLSILHHRMAKLGLGRMPHVASSVIDAEALEIIRDWIEQLPGESKQGEK